MSSYTALQRAVSAYLYSMHILPFGFARQYSLGSADAGILISIMDQHDQFPFLYHGHEGIDL